MSAPKNMAKRAAAGTLALAVCLSAGAALAGSASAAPGFKFDQRVAGADRYMTAVEASKAAFPTGAESVVVVNGDRTVDGLTASYVAGLHNAPILYVNADGKSISTETHDEIARLKAKNVYIVGGTTVVGANLETEWKKNLAVVRYDGADRFETAAKVAVSGGTANKPGKVFIASGTSYADALVVGPIAYAKHYPILLTSNTGATGFTTSALSSLDESERIVVGGTDVVTPAVNTEVAGTKRLAGEGRQATAVEVAKHAISVEGFSSANVALVGNLNNNAADALVASPLAGKNGVPLLFIDAGYAGAPTATYLSANSASLTGKGWVFGGTTAVPAAAADSASAAAQSAPVVSGLSVTATGSASVAVDKTVTYTVGGLTDGSSVRIALVAPTAVDAATGTFTLGTGNRTAALTAASNAQITKINGVALGASAAVAVDHTVTGTSITFTVADTDATNPAKAVPVVFKKSDAADTTLNVNLDGKATEVAGFGGLATFAVAATPVAAEQASASITGALVDSINGTTSFTTDEVGATGSLKMLDTDEYKLGGASITKAQFQSILSIGDNVDVTYVKSATADNKSVFKINTDAFVTATTATNAVAAPTAKGSVATVKYTHPVATTVGGTTFTLQRAQVVSGITGAFSTVKSGTVDVTATEQTFTETLSDGAYVYRLVYTAPSFSGSGTIEGNASAQVAVPAAAVAAAPAVVRTYTTSNSTAINSLNKGDQIKVVFDRPITAPIQGAKLSVGGELLTFTAADATTAGASTFAVNAGAETIDGASLAAGRVLTVTLLKDPANPVALPSTLTLAAGSGIANGTGDATVLAANNTVDR